MLTIVLIAGLIVLALLGLIYLLSLTPANTVCPKCKQKKPPREYGWKMLCKKCEGGEDE